MTIEVSASEFSKALSIASRASNNKLNLGHPSAFRLTAKDNKITLAAFDLSTAIECSVNALVNSPLDVVISAQMLKDILSSSSGDRIELNDIKKKGRLGISSMRCNWDIGYLQSDDYPIAPELADDARILSIPATDLIDVLAAVVYAASSDETRPNIMTVNLQLARDADKLLITSASTDGHRLAIVDYHLDQDSESLADDKLNIPAKAVKDLVAVLKSDEVHEDTVLIEYDDSLIKFTWQDIEKRDRVIISRLIDGGYPPYKSIVPNTFTGDVLIDRRALLAAVNRASIVAKSSNYKVIVSIDDICSLKADQEIGGSVEDIEDIQINGDPIALTFNYKYLQECLKNIESDRVLIKYKDSNTPVLVTGEHEDNSISAIHILMPIGKAGQDD